MSSFAYTEIPRENLKIPGANNAHGVTPYFMHMNLLNEERSEAEKKPIYEMIECVQIRLAGDRNYVPVVPVNSMFVKVGNRVITYAERFAEQYRAFLSGSAQITEGTPLEELISYGITPAQLSICRSLNINSIESLLQLEGKGVKNLGYHANELKPMARKWSEARSAGISAKSEIEALKAELAELRAAAGMKEAGEIPAVLPDVTVYDDLSNDELKDLIEAKAGARPRGQPSRETLISSLKTLEE